MPHKHAPARPDLIPYYNFELALHQDADTGAENKYAKQRDHAANGGVDF